MLPCPQAAEPDSSWCLRHGRMQAQLFKTYKRLSTALKELCASEALPSVEQIADADDLAQVKAWEEIVVRRLRMIDRTATGRSVHHERF
ncbi:BQ2448_5676 [Microbotryum intermedium]|uniref:BQ2448_5676 protein n=1 Tax=Microbotryum intermedium TaxID=269621 RepID=A0A238EYW6_9BASI|nr:BQ2448_5676 [Microbotryum intermedium]